MDGRNISTEDDLFKFLKEKINDLQKTNEFDCTDVFSLSYNFRAELKCRNTHYDSLLIEKFKWDNLIKYKELNIRYINSTPNGVYSFDLRKIKEPEWFIHKMPKTTHFDDNEKINKQVGYLPINLSKQIWKRY